MYSLKYEQAELDLLPKINLELVLDSYFCFLRDFLNSGSSPSDQHAGSKRGKKIKIKKMGEKCLKI